MRPMPELQVVMMPPDELAMYEGNAKLHTADQIDQIASSIEEFDFSDPIGAWHDDDGNAVIIEGHGRLFAARKLGIETVPVIFLDHLTDDQRRAYALVHNQLTMSSGFDYEMLMQELEAITSIPMEEYGFDRDDADQIDIDKLIEDDAKAGNEFERQTVVCPNCGHENKVVTDV